MSRIQLLVRGIALLLALQIPSGFAANSYDDASKLFKQGNYAGALEKVDTILATTPRDARARFLKGLILTEQSKPADAIKVFTSLTEDYPELPEPYNNLAVLYAEQGQYDKARQSLEKAIKTHPSYATAHENLGDIYAKMASDAYDKALQLDRSNSRAQTKLSMIKELFSSSSMVPSATPRPEEPARIAAAPVAPPPAPVEVVKPVENKTRPVLVPAAKEIKPVEKPPVKEESKPMEEPKADSRQAVQDAVDGWARAWSARDVDAYLACYADDFKTPNGEPRSEWQNTRKQRIRAPSSIQVEVLNPKTSVEGDHATISFKQSYRAGDNVMRTSKTLHLKKSGERWLITQEIAGH
jgi:tetratricopeptide (TPR) repeat protein